MTETVAQGWSTSDQEAVRAELERIFRNSAFQQSRRRQKFLEFLVSETLAGRGDRLKGYTIAVEVFERPSTFDPLVDPVVRIEAGRLRDKLSGYYAGDGANDPVRIELPKGSYTPLIEIRRTGQGEVAPPTTPAPEPQGVGAPLQMALSRVLNHPRWHLAAAAALVILATTVGALHLRRAPAPEVPRNPVIAVMPFTNLGGDPSEEYFSDGLTEDIMTELSRTRDLSVLARNQTFDLKGKSVDVTKLGRDLKADYVLEGSVQRSGSRLRVTAQLIETQVGRHVWADRFDREMSDVLVVQDELVSEIISKLTSSYGVIDQVESRVARRKSPDQVQSYDLVLRAQEVMRMEWSRRTFAEAKTLLTEAVALDPENARARREIAYLSALGWVFRLDATPTPREEILAQAIKSVQLAPNDARARTVLAAVYFWTNQLDLFEHEAAKALDLAPYDAEILATVGCLIAKSGHWERGVPMVEKANALNSYAAIGWYQSTMGLDAYLKGNHERALAFLRQSPDQDTFYIYIEYIPVLGQLGRTEEARALWQKLLQEEPGATMETFKTWFHLWNTKETDVAKFVEGIDKAGILPPPATPMQ